MKTGDAWGICKGRQGWRRETPGGLVRGLAPLGCPELTCVWKAGYSPEMARRSHLFLLKGALIFDIKEPLEDAVARLLTLQTDAGAAMQRCRHGVPGHGARKHWAAVRNEQRAETGSGAHTGHTEEAPPHDEEAGARGEQL